MKGDTGLSSLSETVRMQIMEIAPQSSKGSSVIPGGGGGLEKFSHLRVRECHCDGEFWSPSFCNSMSSHRCDDMLSWLSSSRTSALIQLRTGSKSGR